MQQQHRKTVRAEAPTTQPNQLLHQRKRRKAVSTRDEHHLSQDKERRCKSTTNQMRRLDGRTRKLLGDKCLLGSKCPASSRDRPRRKHPWGSVGGWNVPRGRPMVTQPSPSRRPALLINRDGMGRPTRRRRTLQLRADRGSVSPRADLEIINS